MTASSVTSVSDAPPSLLVCVNKAAALNQTLHEQRVFAVCVLHEGQQQVSVNCATPGEGARRFEIGNWALDENSGLSYLADSLCTFICEKQQTVSHGTHDIVIGNLTKVIIEPSDSPILVYAKGAYHNI